MNLCDALIVKNNNNNYDHPSGCEVVSPVFLICISLMEE